MPINVYRFAYMYLWVCTQAHDRHVILYSWHLCLMYAVHCVHVYSVQCTMCRPECTIAVAVQFVSFAVLYLCCSICTCCMLYSVCMYAVQCVHVCCTICACMLYSVCMYAVQCVHVCCTVCALQPVCRTIMILVSG